LKQINVIIAESNREDNLISCLHYLNLANVGKNYSVDVYVVKNGYTPNQHVQDNINIHTIFHSMYSKEFNKSKLLNYGLFCMKKQFSWLSVVDVDMIYCSDFFSMIDMCMHSKSYVISKGAIPGTSQISMSYEVYNLFKEIYGEKLYCEEFVGWGGEDSDVSFKAMDMRKSGLINIVKLPDLWYHTPHERTEDNKENNLKLFESRRDYNIQLLKKWMCRTGSLLD
jgi:hypothetical protein